MCQQFLKAPLRYLEPLLEGHLRMLFLPPRVFLKTTNKSSSLLPSNNTYKSRELASRIDGQCQTKSWLEPTLLRNQGQATTTPTALIDPTNISSCTTTPPLYSCQYHPLAKCNQCHTFAGTQGDGLQRIAPKSSPPDK